MTDDARVFKLVGPVLLRQDKAEAHQNIEKRLEFINGEVYVDYLLIFRVLIRTAVSASKSSWGILARRRTRSASRYCIVLCAHTCSLARR
jgi:hypothetical protein